MTKIDKSVLTFGITIFLKFYGVSRLLLLLFLQLNVIQQN